MYDTVVALDSKQHTWKWPKLRGLQARMTFSYVGMTTAFVLLLEILTFLFLVFAIVNSQLRDDDASLAKRVAIQYAYAASLQANGSTLNPRSTFQPGLPGSLAPLGNSVGGNAHGNSLLINIIIPYVAERTPATPPIAIALLIASNGRVAASSYPYRYPVNMPTSALLPRQAQLISHALLGVSTTAGDSSNTIYVAETVWDRNEKPIGVVYVQGTVPLINLTDILPFVAFLLPMALIFLVITAPIGGLFGLFTTRSLVRRIRQLVAATTNFANGDYTQRVRLTRKDEVGQLELHFNSMADQLVESITRQQELAGQNARLAERARISRELHDVISQDLFSLHMLAYGLQDALPAGSELHQHVTTLERITSRMIREMRALLLELRPAHLEQLGLAEALKDLAATYSERLGITVTANVMPISLGSAAEQALLRIAQEALSNAVRHAHATQITLTLAKPEQGVTLMIADNGDGFVFDESQKQHGLGLHLMQERIRELQGTFVIETAPGEGTHISVCLPESEEEL